MRYYVIALAIILLLAVGGYTGFTLGHSRADDQFESAYRNAEERIGNLEQELERSRTIIGELRSRNQQIELIASGIERDRDQLEELNIQFRKRIEDLHRVNHRLRDSILSAHAGASGITYNVEHIEAILRDIESQQ